MGGVAGSSGPPPFRSGSGGGGTGIGGLTGSRGPPLRGIDMMQTLLGQISVTLPICLLSHASRPFVNAGIGGRMVLGSVSSGQSSNAWGEHVGHQAVG